MGRIVLGIVAVMWVLCGAGHAEARDKRPTWKKLDRALTYLRAVPEVAWVKYEGRNVLIGWRGPSAKFARINKTAAQKAARALHGKVTVYSLPAEQTSLRDGDEESYLCKTTATPRAIVQSNCR